MRSPEFVKCSTCGAVAVRVGTQDSCDVYVCVDQHVTRVPIK